MSNRSSGTILSFLAAFFLGAAGKPVLSQGSGESGRICEVEKLARCLDREVLEGASLKVPMDYVAIARDGLLICDSSFNYVASPDLVLIMDNTSSMQKVQVIDGIPRWCAAPDKETGDPGCISGDPERLRGPALQSFLDSALVKGGQGINVGVVTFSETAEAKSEKLVPLNQGTIGEIKSTIIMNEFGGTNYTEAFIAARRLLATSQKPVSRQFIIFVSDGRPNYPTRPHGDPYTYKSFWDSLPAVHSIFLGDNKANYQDMQDVSEHTGGRFFNISDVSLLAKLLTDDLAETLFRRAAPTLTEVRNLSESILFRIDAEAHKPSPDTGAYVLDMPGPLYLGKGENRILVRTEYENAGTTQDVSFKVERSATGPYHPGLEAACRGLPELKILNASGVVLNRMHLPYTLADTAVEYELTTAADLDSFDLAARLSGPATAQEDSEILPNGAWNRRDSTWSGSRVFEHQTIGKTPLDGKLQAEHGEALSITYHHPFIPEDSARAVVRMKYGPDHDKAYYLDSNGDGRIDAVSVRFLDPLPVVPQRLRFTLRDASGKRVERIARESGGEIRFAEDADGARDNRSLDVAFGDPFPFGITSVADPDTSGHTYRQTDIPMVDGAFRVDDSVPPVILSAEVGADKATGATRVQVIFSEPVDVDGNLLQPLVFKREERIFSEAEIPVSRLEKTGDREYVFILPPDSRFKPVGGDSVAINDNGEIRDAFGRPPGSLVFTPLGGPAPSQAISDLYVTFANGSKSEPKAAADSPDKGVGFIPIDSKGFPIPGESKGKCGGCTPSRDGLFAGSVIVIVTKQPVSYRFTIFTNLGEVVARGEGKVEEPDLFLLGKKEDPGGDPNQAEYVQRIVWTGRSESGHMAGTGAYVLKADFTFDRNLKTGARAASGTKVTKFGFLRGCCEAFNSKWYY